MSWMVSLLATATRGLETVTEEAQTLGVHGGSSTSIEC